MLGSSSVSRILAATCISPAGILLFDLVNSAVSVTQMSAAVPGEGVTCRKKANEV